MMSNIMNLKMLFLQTYQSVKIHEIPEYEEEESIPEYTCGICGLRDRSKGSIRQEYDGYCRDDDFFFLSSQTFYAK